MYYIIIIRWNFSESTFMCVSTTSSTYAHLSTILHIEKTRRKVDCVCSHSIEYVIFYRFTILQWRTKKLEEKILYQLEYFISVNFLAICCFMCVSEFCITQYIWVSICDSSNVFDVLYLKQFFRCEFNFSETDILSFFNKNQNMYKFDKKQGFFLYFFLFSYKFNWLCTT